MIKLKICLTLGFLMILSACSTAPSRQTEVVMISVPEHLMQEFCEWRTAGATVRDLADGYVHNTLCGKKYEAQVKEQKEYLEKMKSGV